MALTPDQIAEQQKLYSKYVSAGTGAASLYANAYQNANWADNININVPVQGMDQNGRPTFNLAPLQQSIDSLHGNNVIGASTLNAASQGAAAGTAIMPGIGTAVGGLVGGISDVVGNILGNDKAKKKRRLAEQNLLQAQRIYNNNLSQFNNNFLAQQDYLDKANNSNRLYNLYKYNTPGNI